MPSTPARLAVVAVITAAALALPTRARAQDAIPTFDQLLAHTVQLKPELVGVHPRVFVTSAELEALRLRAHTTHKAEWERARSGLVALTQAPPPAPGPQERRSQNNVALAITGREPRVGHRPQSGVPAMPRRRGCWPRSTTSRGAIPTTSPTPISPPGHLLYAIGWAYDLLYDELSPAERGRIRASLERHAGLVYDAFAPEAGDGS